MFFTACIIYMAYTMKSFGQDYVQYHNGVSNVIQHCINNEYQIAINDLEVLFNEFEPFAEEYILAAFIVDQLNDSSKYSKYINLV